MSEIAQGYDNGIRVVENRTRKLGRLKSYDLRDHKFALSRINTSRLHRHWHIPIVLDQGNTSMCVAYSGTSLLLGSPVKNLVKKAKNQKDLNDFLRGLYDDCQRNDEWPGEDYDGTSVRACMKCLQREGYLSSYRWAFDILTMANYVLEVGPMQVGTLWTDQMFDPDSKGYITLGEPARLVGGHAYLLSGVNKRKRNPDKSMGAFRIMNSWGKTWGQKGEAWISFRDMEVLMREDGEAAAAIEILK